MTSTDFRVEAIDRLCFVCGSIEGSHESNLLENVTSSNICHSCWTQRCTLFSGVRYSVVCAMQRCSLFRGVRYSEMSAIQRCPVFRGVRY